MVLFTKYNSSVECNSHQEICHSTPRTSITTFCSTVQIQAFTFLPPGRCTCWFGLIERVILVLKTGPVKIESDILGSNLLLQSFFYAGCKLHAGLDIFYFQKSYASKKSLFTPVIITITKFLKCAVQSLITNSFINSCCHFEAFGGKRANWIL